MTDRISHRCFPICSIAAAMLSLAILLLTGCSGGGSNVSDLTYDQLTAFVVKADKLAAEKLDEFNKAGGEKNPYTIAEYEHRFIRGNANGFQVCDVVYQLRSDAIPNHPIHTGFPNDFTVVIKEDSGEMAFYKVGAKR